MTSYFIIYNVEERPKHNYILLSTGPKGREIMHGSSKIVFKIFETPIIQKSNKWLERLEFASMQQNEDEIDEYLTRQKLRDTTSIPTKRKEFSSK